MNRITDFQIRHACRADAEAIRTIYASPRVCAGTLQLPYPALAIWEQRLENRPGSYSLVLEIEGEVVGQIGFEAYQNPRRKHAGTLGMGVRDDFQGRGIGSRLLAAALDLADNWLNLSRVELTVYTDNEPAIALYKKHGFAIEGESARYAFRNGAFVSVYHMARIKP